jgi:predicted DCC family thiol-disulfide oxidoreductase YuxK
VSSENGFSTGSDACAGHVTANYPMTSNDPFSYRSDPSVPSFADDRPIIIFDGMCVFCSRFAQFVIRNDRNHRFRLLAAQTPIGSALYRHFGLNPVDYETSLLIKDGRVWLKSEASILIFELLGFPWSMASAGRLLPRRVRDWLYDIIATHRLRWFGARTTCFLPEPSQADRFIE